MTDRVPLDHLTSDQYDQLCGERDRLSRLHLTALGDLGIATHRLDQIRDAARLHRQQLISTRELYAVIEADEAPVPEATGHVYLSTGCFHGDHGYCKSMTGLNGSKRPGECKHCGTKCTCGCHGTEETSATPEPGLYEKITVMFSGPLPPPTDEPPATVLPCSWAQTRYAHTPHPWQPQPGMRHVQCPGYAQVPAGTEATDTTKEN